MVCHNAGRRDTRSSGKPLYPTMSVYKREHPNARVTPPSQSPSKSIIQKGAILAGHLIADKYHGPLTIQDDGAGVLKSTTFSKEDISAVILRHGLDASATEKAIGKLALLNFITLRDGNVQFTDLGVFYIIELTDQGITPGTRPFWRRFGSAAVKANKTPKANIIAGGIMYNASSSSSVTPSSIDEDEEAMDVDEPEPQQYDEPPPAPLDHAQSFQTPLRPQHSVHFGVGGLPTPQSPGNRVSPAPEQQELEVPESPASGSPVSHGAPSTPNLANRFMQIISYPFVNINPRHPAPSAAIDSASQATSSSSSSRSASSEPPSQEETENATLIAERDELKREVANVELQLKTAGFKNVEELVRDLQLKQAKITALEDEMERRRLDGIASLNGRLALLNGQAGWPRSV